jgi:hypothetical protein
MSAAPIDLPSNAPADVERRPDAIWVPGTEFLVPSFYDARWHNQHLGDAVTQNGAPIVVNNETLTIGLIPPWRRYAVQPGSAELVSQDDFARAKRMADIEYVYEKSGGKSSLAFPEQEPIPNVREFVSWKRHPGEPERLIPLGTSHERQPAKLSERLYDKMSQRLISFNELPQATQAQVIAEIQSAGGDVTPPAEPAPPLEPASQQAVKRMMAATAAPCGREAKSKAGALAHSRSCPDCQAVMANGPEEAA